MALAILQSHAKPPPKPTVHAVSDFKESLIHWIVELNVPLNVVNHDTSQRLLRTPIDIINAALPSHHETIKHWVMDDFHANRKAVADQLGGAKSEKMVLRTKEAMPVQRQYETVLGT